MTSIRQRLVILTGLVAGLLAGSGIPVLADGTPTALDEPPVGRHVLIDDREFPGADCRTHLGALTSIGVRRPVMYARNRTSGVDHQTVGWRWQLRDSAFALVAQGPIEQATASDERPAAYSGQTVDMTGRPAGTWFIAIRMFWYQPGSSTHIQGKALHFVRNYSLRGSFRLPFDGGCDPASAAILQEPLPEHTGVFGVHVLLDDIHEAPVLCAYGPGALGGLVSVKVRQPVMFAVDSGAGTQTQRVKWRFRVQTTEDAIPDKFSVWTTLSPSVSFVSASATDHRPAGFAARSRSITHSERSHVNFRVQVIMDWLDSGGSVTGSAVHVAEHYQIVLSDGTLGGVSNLCGPSPAV